MEIYYYDAGASTASYLIPALVIPVVVAGAVGLIVALTKSSCPYVYIHNGNNFDFSGEIYSGSVYASLERDDYLPLPGFLPHDGSYKVKIANKLPEKQYLNLTELWIIEHDPMHEVLVDRHGKIQTFYPPVSPVSAISDGGTEVKELVASKDGKYYMFCDEPGTTGDSMAMNNLVLQFSLPEKGDSAKLILRAKNSVWGDYIYGEFSKLFGDKYSHWIKVQGKLPPDRHIQWKKDQCLVMMAYLETEEGWRFVDYFDMAGPLAFRDLVMAFGIRDAKRDSSGNIRIMLSSGFLFWELDFAGLDCSKNEPVAPVIFMPASAVNQDGREVRKRLLAVDHDYYEQPVPGDEVVIDFPANRAFPADRSRAFLHVRGYYEHIRNYRNQPEKEILTEFLKPGMLSRFSYQKFTDAKARYSYKP